MKIGSRLITFILILLSLVAATASITANKIAASAEGVPQLFPADQYDDPYYNQPASYKGTGFSTNSFVTLVLTNTPGGTFTVGTTKTDIQGTFHFTLKHMPSIPHKTVATLSAADSNGRHATTGVRETAFITSKQIAGAIGSTVDIAGGGFGSKEAVELSFNQAQNLPVASVTADASGVFHATFKVPVGAQRSNDTIVAKGASGAVSLTAFSVLPAVTLTPASGSSGTTITIDGQDFTPGGQIALSWYNPNTRSTIQLGGTTANNDGTFQTLIVAPGDLASGNHYALQVTDVASGEGRVATFQVH